MIDAAQIFSGVFGLLGLIAASGWTIFRILSARIEQNRVDMSDKAKELHGRIDGVKDNYVRRDDLDRHMMRFDKNLDEMKVMIGAINTSLVQLMKNERKS